MLGRAFGISALLVLAALAGCISKSQNPETNTSTNTTTAGFLADNSSVAAPDGRGKLSAFNETNQTEASGIGAMEHKHDYWRGQTRAHVADFIVPLIPLPLLPCKQAGSCTVGGNGETYPPATDIADFAIPRPDPANGTGGLIYEGTSSVEVLANYIRVGTSSFTGGTPAEAAPDPDHPNAHVFVDYLTAADEPGKFHTGGEIKVGTPFVIKIKPTDADMPHQTRSLWILRFYSDSTTGTFQANVTITAVKGNDVVNWPPHPELYGKSPEREIFNAPVHTESKGTVDSNLYGSDSPWISPDRIISWGTDRVDITVSNAKLTTQVPVPAAGYVLEVHNATKLPLLGSGAQYGSRLTDSGTDGTTWHFSVDVSKDFDSYDTPYGAKSRWGFRFVPEFDNGGAACVDDGFIQEFLVGCQFIPWTMDYQLQVKAIGHPHTSELPDPNTAGAPTPAAPTAPTK